VVIARNALNLETKLNGNGSYNFALFTSQHGHYSVEITGITLGLGKAVAVPVLVDEAGCIIPTALRETVIQVKTDGKTPIYVNSASGTPCLAHMTRSEPIQQSVRSSISGSISMGRGVGASYSRQRSGTSSMPPTGELADCQPS
jgi:high-affinity K+ transport system ATPase subunit B